MTADFVMSLSRKVNDKISGTGRWHIIKNRFGPDGMTLPCKMDTSNGQIFIYEESSHGGQEQQGKMNQGSEFVRKELAKNSVQWGK